MEVVATALVIGTVAVHFAFIGYLVIGGFLALRWRRTLALHILAVLWGIGSTLYPLPCPLTSVERWARERAGMGPLPPDGFIAHYLTGVLYPGGAVGVVRGLVVGVVLLSWLLVHRHELGATRTSV
ncbi:hypothetical protein A5727_04850 [Mycobacterium sp. ACS4331]|nr:hypothetical protein A5727_04850 [Mycobacterium sp. ACS4331]